MKIEIKNVKGEAIFSHECEENTIRKVVKAAIEQEADLSGANLSRADISDADLGYADLSGADLGYADLRGADLSRANLSGACLSYADLSYADLSGANLSGANLSGANLGYADLSDADLGYANLSGANLGYADLRGADLDNVIFNERTSFFSMQCPEEGSFIGWKVASEKIVKLLITEDSKRSSATSLKCRCSKAKVLDIQEADGSPSNVNEVKSNYDDSFIYKIGEVIKVDDFDENRWNECSTGIHFFVSRDMAVRYY